MLPDITSVLLRFRMPLIALNGDLKKMFCQTEVIYDHQFYQLYLWHDCNAAITPKVFAMQRLMFGITSRPFLAIQCVLHHGQKDRIVAKYGDSSYNLLRDNMYMDDVHLGGDTVEDVVKKQQMLAELFQSGRWNLVKFATNSSKVLKAISKESRLHNLVLGFDENEFG